MTNEPPEAGQTNDPEEWHLDKRVPIAIICTVLVQCASLVWWARGIEKDVSDHSTRLSVIDAQRISERLSTLESQLHDLRSSLLRIESKLDRLVESRGGRNETQPR